MLQDRKKRRIKTQILAQNKKVRRVYWEDMSQNQQKCTFELRENENQSLNKGKNTYY